MEIDYQYYYNDVPGEGLCRNNLVYTSLINQSKTKFVQWFYNDSEYHKNQNEVLDPELMEQKWQREVNMLLKMHQNYPEHVPNILDIDHNNKKIVHGINGVDFWEQSHVVGFDAVLSDWQEQMLEILQAYKTLGLYKFSLHPSSYFVVDGKLKSINYFFCYHESEPCITVKEHLSHISLHRRKFLIPKMHELNIDMDSPTDFARLQILCLESFRNVYPTNFIDQAILIYK
jgi:hypothetical protein